MDLSKSFSPTHTLELRPLGNESSLLAKELLFEVCKFLDSKGVSTLMDSDKGTIYINRRKKVN